VFSDGFCVAEKLMGIRVPKMLTVQILGWTSAIVFEVFIVVAQHLQGSSWIES
jgi:hypothetical protein